MAKVAAVAKERLADTDGKAGEYTRPSVSKVVPAAGKRRRFSSAVVVDSLLEDVSDKQFWQLRLAFLAVLLPAGIAALLCLRNTVVLQAGWTHLWRGVLASLRVLLSTPLTLAVFLSACPELLSRRQVLLLTVGIVAVRLPLLTAVDGMSPLDRNPHAGSLAFRVVKLVYDMSTVVLNLGVPLLLMKLAGTPLRSQDERRLSFKSTAMGIGATLLLLYSAMLSTVTAWTQVDLLSALGSTSIMPWAAAVLYDMYHGGRFRRCAFYAAAFAYTVDVLGYGAAATLAGNRLLAAQLSPVFAPVLTYILFSATMTALRFIFARTAAAFFGGQDGLKFMFAVQLFEDIFCELAFMGVTSFSPTFFLIMLITVCRQLGRDTQFTSDTLTRLWRRLRGKSLHMSLERRRRRFEFHSRIMEQNVISELMTAVFVPCMLLIDLLPSYGGACVTAGLSRAEVLDQVVVYAFLLALELAMHYLVHLVKLRKLHTLARGDSGTADSYRAGRRKSSAAKIQPAPRGRLDWNAADIEKAYTKWTYHYLRRNAAYFLMATAYVGFDATNQMTQLQVLRSVTGA
eukprot:PLAT7092.12.p1 GENE.PLAT7092.12~~PLAT7092.12.p1  ORF type:complete len:569 (+),score=276.61 PLAT7092.12:34-1740(+)